MSNTNKKISADFINIIIKAIENKIYGSIEVYFEEGRVTQITQRIIKKVSYHSVDKEAKTTSSARVDGKNTVSVTLPKA